jgi:hypothetical protein
MTASQNPGGDLEPAELLKKPLDLDQLLDVVRRHSANSCRGPQSGPSTNS